MKYILILVFFIAPFVVRSQKIKSSEYDPFYKQQVKTTSTEMLAFRPGESVRVGIKKNDDRLILVLKLSQGSIFSVAEGLQVIFLFENGETSDLTCIRGGVADYSPGAASFYYQTVLYNFPDELKTKFLANALKGVRVELSGDSYVDFRNIRHKKKWAIRDMLQLL